MTQLSPQAQTVLDAWNNEWSKGSFCHDQRAIAAALRAAADQMAPLSTNRRQNDIRFGLLRIADELTVQ
jgi:hypothetical protein